MWVPKWIVAASLAVLALALRVAGGGLALRAFEGGGPCGNELVATDTAPRHEYQAIVFVRNCGATTTFGMRVFRQALVQRGVHIVYAIIE